MLPKANKDTSLEDNWRPISLLNTDYKIISKVIANRIKKVLPLIIDSSQAGFVKGRNIHDNIRLLFQLFEDLENKPHEALLFFTDFKKAFDTLNHDFLFDTLKHFNFDQSIINWVKLFYKDAKSCVINNGHISPFFSIKKGVRQGCPLSPYLFILCIELLSNFVRKSPIIRGLKINGYEIKSVMFADDATFVTDGSRRSFENLINILDNFGHVSGLILNDKKCIVLRAGSLQNTDIEYCKNKKFIWESQTAKTLGISFYNNTKLNYKNNIDPKIKEFVNCLKQWQHRKLTLLGKITVIKSFALPKLTYIMSALPNLEANTVKSIERYAYDFLWEGKPDKIKRATIKQQYSKGGLKMVDFEKYMLSLKASWVKKMLDENNKTLIKDIFLSKLNSFGNNLIFECNIDEKEIANKLKNCIFLSDIIAVQNQKGKSFFPFSVQR
jgi:hypothetical protein